MTALAGWHDARLWLAPSELLDRIVRERRVLEVGLRARPPARPVAPRAVRRSTRRARSRRPRPASLRDFLRWADLQSAEGARVVETVLPETDDDAVRILTIHGAKGLEFPIAIVSGMTTGGAAAAAACSCSSRTTRVTYALRVSARVTTEEFERYEPIDEQMDFHEKLRLLYVALTRARDHLVVSVHRNVRATEPGERVRWTHAELLWAAADGAPHWSELEPLDPGATAAPGAALARVEPGLPWDEWLAARDRALSDGARRRVRSATALARKPRRERGRRNRWWPTPGSPKTPATSSCLRGTRAATAPRSAARCTRCCRPSISSPATASRRPRARRPRPRA